MQAVQFVFFVFWYRRDNVVDFVMSGGTLYWWQYIDRAWETNCLVQKGIVCVTNCVTKLVQSALQTVLQNRYSLDYKLCYRICTVCITNCATEQVQSALQTVLQNRYSLHYKLYYRTGTVCIKNCATKQVQSGLQTVLQNRYNMHYKLWYRAGTVCITNCAKWQVQSALPEVQHSSHMLYKDVVQLVLIVDSLVTPIHEVLPLAPHHLQTEPHIGTVSVRRCGRPKTGFRNSDLGLKWFLPQSVRTNSVDHPVGDQN